MRQFRRTALGLHRPNKPAIVVLFSFGVLALLLLLGQFFDLNRYAIVGAVIVGVIFATIAIASILTALPAELKEDLVRWVSRHKLFS